MFLGIATLLLIIWIIGLVAHVTGGLIHILLVLAIIAAVVHFLKGSKTTT